MECKKVLLLVEDDAATRYVLGAILQGMGNAYEVVSEATSAKAVVALRRQSFDLMITDLVLGAEDGVEVTREARAQDPNVPVIWITGFGCQHFEQEAHDLGVFCCLDKPAPASLVRRMVRMALEAEGQTASSGGGAGWLKEGQGDDG